MAGGSPQHVTVSSGGVTTVNFDYSYEYVEVLNVDGAAVVYFTLDGTTPVVGAEGTEVLPGAISSLRGFRPSFSSPGGGRQVKLIAASGTVLVSVAGRTLKARSS